MTDNMQDRKAPWIDPELLRSPAAMVAISGIVLGNMVPLIGVLFWGWELFEIFYIYWIENVIVGVFTWIRMLALGMRHGIGGILGALFMCAFFTVHYGLFCKVHGMIMTEIFYGDKLTFELTEQNLLLLPWLIGMQGYIYALLGIILVEAIFNMSALRKDLTHGKEIGMVMMAPYGRIIILHVTILIGGGLSMWLGFPPVALIFLIILKILYDLGMMRMTYNSERQAILKD